MKKEIRSESKKKKKKDNLTFLVSSLMVRGGVFASGAFGSMEEGEAQGDGGVNEMSSGLGLERSMERSAFEGKGEKGDWRRRQRQFWLVWQRRRRSRHRC